LQQWNHRTGGIYRPGRDAEQARRDPGFKLDVAR
jgi:hypothetical protein